MVARSILPQFVRLEVELKVEEPKGKKAGRERKRWRTRLQYCWKIPL